MVAGFSDSSCTFAHRWTTQMFSKLMDEYYLALVLNFIFKLFLIFIIYKNKDALEQIELELGLLSTVMKKNARN